MLLVWYFTLTSSSQCCFENWVGANAGFNSINVLGNCFFEASVSLLRAPETRENYRKLWIGRGRCGMKANCRALKSSKRVDNFTRATKKNLYDKGHMWRESIRLRRFAPMTDIWYITFVVV